MPAPSPEHPAPPPGYPVPPPLENEPHVPPNRSSINGFAIAALVVSLVGLPCFVSALGLIFGIVALRQIRRTGQSGRGIAITGMVIGAVTTLVLAVYIPTAILTD